jgi:hypothetical protein
VVTVVNTTLEIAAMLRHDHRRPASSIPDQELGIAALVLLLVVLLTVIFVPGLS